MARGPVIMVRAGQMSWHQMKQGFTGPHYRTHLGQTDRHSRPVLYRTFYFVFGETGRTVLGGWLTVSVKSLAHCLYAPEMSFHGWDDPSSRVKGTCSCLQAILDGELTLSTVAWLSFLFSSLQYWLHRRGPLLQGMQGWLKASHFCAQILWEGTEGPIPRVQITTIQSTGQEMP